MTSEVTFGHDSVIRPRIFTGVPRLDEVWFERFATYNSADVSDAVGPLYTMDPRIAPLYEPIRKVVGQALTVKAWPGDNLAVHGALAMVELGDVLVVDWRGRTDSCAAGARTLVVPFERGLRGVVADGGWRDIDELREASMPVYACGRSAYSPPKQRPGEINVPVSCGGVVVEAGDLVVADDEGIAVVPSGELEAVWAAVDAHGHPAGDRPDKYGRADTRRAQFEAVFADAEGRRVNVADASSHRL